jgi:hypothetical protein
MLKALTDLPMTGKLLGVSFLWNTGLLTRVIQGCVRIVAAAPPLNHRDIPQKDKDRLFLERTFTEWIGQVGLTYGLLYFGQDMAAKLVQAIDPRLMGPNTPSLAPSALLKAVEKHLTHPADQAHFKRALQTTFGDVVMEKGRVLKPAFDLNATHNTIYKRLYGGADLNKFAQVLNRPEWLAVEKGTSKVTGMLAHEVNPYFRNLNGLTNAVSFTVMLATAYISGGPLQDWNDHWLREKVAFKLIDWWEGNSPFRPKGPDGNYLPVPPSTDLPSKPGNKAPFDPASIMTLADLSPGTPHAVASVAAPSFSAVSAGLVPAVPKDLPPTSTFPFIKKSTDSDVSLALERGASTASLSPPPTTSPLPVKPPVLSVYSPSMMATLNRAATSPMAPM